MKHPRLLVLFLFLLVASLNLSAQAQQTTPGAGSTPDTATGNGPLPAQTSRDFWDGDEPGVAWLLLHPYASKGYVKRHTEPIKDRIQELDDLTASNGTALRDVDSRAQKGIQLASEKTAMGNQHADDAANKAQLAQQAATAASTRIVSVETRVGGIDQYKSQGQTEIRFRPGQTVLSKSAKEALDQIAGDLKNQRGYLLEIQGFASGHGQTAIANSRKMADSVLRYLVLNHEIPAYRIYVIGMGDAPMGDAGTIAKHSSGSRVEVSLLKNGLDQAANP
jgi:outer membrane protein OmpA-like peptidoglycan-associated protein